MELREHLIGPCARAVDGQLSFDAGSLIRRLVLFERYTLRSIHLLELPHLIDLFGASGLRALLEDGCLRIDCEPLTISETLTHDEPPGFPEGAMQFRITGPAKPDEYLHECLKVLDRVAGLGAKEAEVLRSAICGALVDVNGAARLAHEGLKHDIETSSPIFAEGMALALRRKMEIDLNPTDIRLEIEAVPPQPLFGEGVLVHHNLASLGVGGPIEIDHALVHGFLAVGNLNLRIALMKHLGGIGGCGPNDLPLLDRKLSFLLPELDPGAQEEQLLRVQALAGAPEVDLSLKPAVDVDALLTARGLPETLALRSWLRGVGQMSDPEVLDSFHVISESLGSAFHSSVGKVIRIALISVSGALVAAAGGPPLSPELDLLDTFLLEQLLPEPGPYSFISRTWPSLFRGA